MPTVVIRRGRLIDPDRYLDEIRDLCIVNGRICPSGHIPLHPDEVIDADGMLVFPGLIDVHVHLREPGDEAAETIQSGGAAALAGGFTSIVAMPNTKPPLDTPERLSQVLQAGASLRGPRIYAMAALTMGRLGARAADLAALAEAGAVGFTDDGDGVQDAAVLQELLKECARLNLRFAEHCQAAGIGNGGVMHAGEASQRTGLPGAPSESEYAMVERDIGQSELLGAPLHLQHISAVESVGLIRDARARGVNVTAEVTPHHLTLTDSDAAAGGTNFKMNPPLRARRDRDALVKAVSDGTLNIIATDHAPHTPESKSKSFVDAPNGVIGLETAAAVIWTKLVLEGILTPLQMAQRMSLAPARAFGLKGGTLAAGMPGDITLFDPNVRWKVDPSQFTSRSRNCPFAGWELRGRPAATIVGGEVRYRDDFR